MGASMFKDLHLVIKDSPSSKLSALEREVLYARLRAFSVRIQYVVWNVAGTVLMYIFSDSLLNPYLINVSLANPGHIEKNGNDSALFEGNKPKLDTTLSEWNQNIEIDPRNAPFNFCWRCKFMRPIRSKHCYECDKCISKFDHHCPMIGNCVGGKNHRYFLLFLFCQSIMLLWCFELSTLDVYNIYYNIIILHLHLHLNSAILFRLLFFVSVGFTLSVTIGLCGFHCYLSATNQTTYEMVKPHMLERWVKLENIRKRKWERIHGKKHEKHEKPDEKQIKNHDNNQYKAVNIDDNDTYTDIRTERRRSPDDNNMLTFSDGILKNWYYFCRGSLSSDWITPLSCKLLKIPKDDDDDDSL